MSEEMLKEIQVMCHNIINSALPSFHPEDTGDLLALVLHERARHINVGERGVANQVLCILGYPRQETEGLGLNQVKEYLQLGRYLRRESWMQRKFIRQLGDTDNIEFVVFDESGKIISRDKWSPQMEDLDATDYSVCFRDKV